MSLPGKDAPTSPLLRLRVYGVLVSVGIAAASVAPVTMVGVDPGFWGRLEQSFELSSVSVSGAVDWLLHVCFFLPVGFTASAWAGGGARRRRWTVLLAIGLFLALIEVRQLFLPSNHGAHVADWLGNVLGALLGYVAGCRSRAALERLHIFYARHERKLHGFGLVAAVVAWPAIWVIPTLKAVSLDTWNRSYRLMVGNEATGDRPWLGEIRALAVYGRSLTDEEVVGCRDSIEATGAVKQRVPLGLLVYYDLTSAAVQFRPEGGALDLPVLVYSGPRPSWPADGKRGLVFDVPSIAWSSGPVESLIDAIVEADEFSVEIWCRSANLSQDGPARILSVSASPSERNFTLGQTESGLQFRVRNGATGPNGSNPAAQTGPKALTRGFHHLVATYHRGESRIFVDGVRAAERLTVRASPLALWFGGVYGGSFIAMLLCVGVVVISCRVVFSGMPGRLRLIVTMAVVYAVAGITWALEGAVCGRLPDGRSVALVGLCLALWYPVAGRFCRSAPASIQ